MELSIDEPNKNNKVLATTEAKKVTNYLGVHLVAGRNAVEQKESLTEKANSVVVQIIQTSLGSLATETKIETAIRK